MAHPRTRRADHHQDAAVGSSVVAFLIAGVLFMGSIVAVLVTTRNASDEGMGDDARTAGFRIQSAGLAELLLESPGIVEDPSALEDWAVNANGFTGKTLSAEELTRLGLLDYDSTEPFMLDFNKFQNLRRAGHDSSATDGYVNYEDANRLFGLEESGLDFHIRSYPTLNDVAELLSSERDSYLKVTYVGDIEVTTTFEGADVALDGLISYTEPTCTIPTDAPRMYRISTTITNLGSSTTQFTVVTSIDLGGNKAQDQNANSFLAVPNVPVVISVDVAALSGRSCSGDDKVADFDIYDPVHDKIATASLDDPATQAVEDTFASDPGAVTTTNIGLYIDTGKQNYRPSESVVLNYDGTSLSNGNDLMLLVCPGTTECTAATDYNGASTATFRHGSASDNTPETVTAGTVFGAENNANSRILSLAAGALGEGEYTAWLYDCQIDEDLNDPCTVADNPRAREQILVTAAAIGGVEPNVEASETLTSDANDPAGIEVAYLESLMQNFCPSYFNDKTTSPMGSTWVEATWTSRCSFKGASPAQPGDVFPDTKKVMNEDLPSRLMGADGVTPSYALTDVLVIGSGVDHNAMTSQSAKGTIETWVRGGGTIVVFGSDDGNVQWLQPLFHSAITGGGGPVSTPDQGHPMLHTPNELDNPAVNYDARDSVWRFNGQTAIGQQSENPPFTNVIVVGDAEEGDPLLSTSNTGALGAGTVIITAYMPWDLYNDDALDAQASAECPGRSVTECEGLKFIHNMLMQGYADLYLDYGPQIPDETDVEPAVRFAQIRHPEFEDPIELTMIVFVF